MMIEAGEPQRSGSGSDPETADPGRTTPPRRPASTKFEQEATGPWKVRPEPVDESVASYSRIAPRPRRRRPTRGAVLGGGDATKAPKRLAMGEFTPIEGDSSGTSWDDPEEL